MRFACHVACSRQSPPLYSQRRRDTHVGGTHAAARKRHHGRRRQRRARAVVLEEALVPQVLLQAHHVQQRTEVLARRKASLDGMLPLTLAVSSGTHHSKRGLTHCTMLNMDTLSLMLKHRNTASQRIYDSRSTVLRSGAPEVSYSSTRAGCAS